MALLPRAQRTTSPWTTAYSGSAIVVGTGSTYVAVKYQCGKPFPINTVSESSPEVFKEAVLTWADSPPGKNRTKHIANRVESQRLSLATTILLKYIDEIDKKHKDVANQRDPCPGCRLAGPNENQRDFFIPFFIVLLLLLIIIILC